MSEGAIVQGEGVEVPLQISEGADQPAVVAAPDETWIALESIEVRLDQVQVRVAPLRLDHIEGMKATLLAGGELPAVILYRITELDLLLLVDGFHRHQAHQDLNRPTIKAIIRAGTVEQALTAAEDANLDNALPLTMDDKYNIYKRRWERGHVLADGHSWASVSGRTRAKLLKVSPDTESRWARKLAETHRITKVITAAGHQVDVSKQKAAADDRAKREAEARLKRKIRLAVSNDKLTDWEAENCKIEEYSANPNDLWLWVTNPKRGGRVKVDGHYKRPADRVLEEKRAVEAAERSIVERPDVADPPPAPKYGPDWKPEGTPIKSAAVGTAPEVAGYTVGLCADLSRTLMYFQANWGQLQLVQSIRSIRDTMPGQVDGLRQKLAEVLVLLDEGNVMLMREHVEDLMGQLDGGGE